MERSAVTVSAIKALGCYFVLRYPGARCLRRCNCDELPCPLLSWLSVQLRTNCPELSETVGTGDILMVGGLRTLLSDMFSPLTELTSEVLEPSVFNKITEFLVSELQAALMIKERELHPKEETTGDESEKEQRMEHHHQEVADEDFGDTDRRKAEVQAEWVLLLRALDMDTSCQFEDVQKEVESRLAQLPGENKMESLLATSLSSKQWTELDKINQLMTKDYECRWQMMIKRFQVTIESFAWGDKQKERREALSLVPPLQTLSSSSRVTLPLLLAARQDQSIIEPIKAGQSTAVYKKRMGSVPDRGGRPGEIEPPMPAWGKRSTKGGHWGKGGGHNQRRKFPDKKKGKKE